MKSNRKSLKTSDLAMIAMFTAIITICSWIAIPSTVPFTLQTFGIFLAVGVLGGKRGTLAVFTYLLLGMMGAPVFAGFSGGLGYIFGSTGGYIIGFLFSALTMWAMERLPGRKKWVLPFSMILGLFVCYLFGTLWFLLIYANTSKAVSLWNALIWCVFPYIIPDLIKIALSCSLYKKLSRVLHNY